MSSGEDDGPLCAPSVSGRMARATGMTSRHTRADFRGVMAGNYMGGWRLEVGGWVAGSGFARKGSEECGARTFFGVLRVLRFGLRTSHSRLARRGPCRAPRASLPAPRNPHPAPLPYDSRNVT